MGMGMGRRIIIMKLTITPAAEEQLRRRMLGKELLVKLKYETDGCGCAVSGVPILQLINPQELDKVHDMKIPTNAMDVYMEKSKTLFFDEEMKIDFLPENQTFRLTSPSEILNGRMNCVVKTN